MKINNAIAPILCALISVAIISYCLAQSQHREPHSGATTVRIRPYNAALQARDQKYDLLVEQGEKLRAANPAAAEVYYRQATSINSQPTDAWMGLARASDVQGKQSQALSAYQKVFGSLSGASVYSTFPSDVEALARYGTLCEDAGQHDAAVRACNQAGERLNPRPRVQLSVPTDRQVASPELHAVLEVVRGIALDQQGMRSESFAAFSRAADLQPNDARVQYYLGYGLQKAGQFAAAQAAYGRASRLDTAGAVKAAAVEGARAAQARRR